MWKKSISLGQCFPTFRGRIAMGRKWLKKFLFIAKFNFKHEPYRLRGQFHSDFLTNFHKPRFTGDLHGIVVSITASTQEARGSNLGSTEMLSRKISISFNMFSYHNLRWSTTTWVISKLEIAQKRSTYLQQISMRKSLVLDGWIDGWE